MKVSEGKVRLSHVTVAESDGVLVVEIDTRTKGFDVSTVTGSFSDNHPRAGSSEIEIMLDANKHSLRTDEDAQTETVITVVVPEKDWIFSVEGGGGYGARLIGVRRNGMTARTAYSGKALA